MSGFPTSSPSSSDSYPSLGWGVGGQVQSHGTCSVKCTQKVRVYTRSQVNCKSLKLLQPSVSLTFVAKCLLLEFVVRPLPQHDSQQTQMACRNLSGNQQKLAHKLAGTYPVEGSIKEGAARAPCGPCPMRNLIIASGSSDS